MLRNISYFFVIIGPFLFTLQYEFYRKHKNDVMGKAH